MKLNKFDIIQLIKIITDRDPPVITRGLMNTNDKLAAPQFCF